MRTLTEKQAFDAMRKWLALHARFDWDVHKLILISDYGSLKADGSPWTNDPGEWGEWEQCVAEVLDEENPRASQRAT